MTRARGRRRPTHRDPTRPRTGGSPPHRLRLPRAAARDPDLTGATVHGTATYGKHLLTRIAEHTLHTHLKMEGEWRTYPVGRRWDRPGHLARVVLGTADRQAVGFALGVVELVPTAAEQSILSRLGPDLLGAEWDVGEAARRLGAAPERALGEALLDQTVVAGIGTIYLAEACFVHGVHPLTPAGAVPDPARLLDRARAMLRFGVEQGRPVTTGEGRAPLWVYRRDGRPCRRCGAIIVAGPLGEPGRERRTYWCPRCQPADRG